MSHSLLKTRTTASPESTGTARASGRPSSEDTLRRDRTYRRLLAAAMALVGRGRVPSVAEVALKAGVSRATAYRYFPSRSQLISTVVAESLGPVRRYVPKAADGRERVRELFSQTFPRFKEFEPHMRAALQLSLEHESLIRVGLLDEKAYRRGFRRRLLRRAAAPLKELLGSRRFAHLLKALSVVYGVEPYVILKDIWGSNDREIETITLWMVDALLAAALRDSRTSATKTGDRKHRMTPLRRTPAEKLP